MAYQQFDLHTPILTEWTLNSKAKQTILDHWPKRVIDGVEVFGDIRIANDQNYDPLNAGEKEIMKIFGVDPVEIASQDYKSVADARFRFKHGDIDASVVTYPMLYAEITRSSTIDEEHDERRVTFQYVSYDKPLTEVHDNTTGISKVEEIRTKFEEGTDLKDHYYMDCDEEPTWHLAYADVEKSIYNRRFVIRPPLIATDHKGRTTYETRIELIYSLKDQPLPYIMDLNTLFVRVKENDVYPPEFVSRLYNPHPGSQVGYLEDSDDLYHAELVSSYEDDYGDTVNEYNYHLKCSALEGLKLKAFAKFIKNVLEFNHRLREVPWWEKAIAVIIVIIVIIIAILITYFSLGAGAGIAKMGAVALIAAVASAIAITATIISFALTMYATWLVDRGYAGTAILVGRCAVTFSEIAKYAGYVALAAGIWNIAANGFTQAAPAGAKEGINGAYMQNGSLVVPMSNGQIANLVVSWINSAVGFGLEHLNDEDQKETAELQEDVNAQAELLADYTSPKSMAAMQVQFESGALYEPRLETPSYCYNKTQGLVDLATTKYY